MNKIKELRPELTALLTALLLASCAGSSAPSAETGAEAPVPVAETTSEPAVVAPPEEDIDYGSFTEEQL
ncbi:MAG: hypothetical protein HOD87_09670, partial [Gammaproteobacteria bacterium]|nr:hypothetical protein [Gammaproteobacteria bacterium]